MEMLALWPYHGNRSRKYYTSWRWCDWCCLTQGGQRWSWAFGPRAFKVWKMSVDTLLFKKNLIFCCCWYTHQKLLPVLTTDYYHDFTFWDTNLIPLIPFDPFGFGGRNWSWSTSLKPLQGVPCLFFLQGVPCEGFSYRKHWHWRHASEVEKKKLNQKLSFLLLFFSQKNYPCSSGLLVWQLGREVQIWCLT